MNSFLNPFRHKVSADKNRYLHGAFDLDLTYITHRIVAMAFPAEGVETLYRNNIDHVAALLQRQHPNHYRLYNLSNRDYDISKFGGNVSNWCGFPDHHQPPLVLLFKIILSIHEWLSEDEENVAVIHCLAGKGRTGTVIASYFLYCGLMSSIEEALNFFSYRRSINSWGVTGPSQLRFENLFSSIHLLTPLNSYLKYYEDIITQKTIPHSTPMKIIQVSFEPIPYFSIGGGEKGCTPYFEIYKLNREKNLIFSSEGMSDQITSFDAVLTKVATFLVDCVVEDDIIFHFRHFTPLHGSEPMFHFGFHVGMVHGNSVITLRHEIEKAEKDDRFSNDFRVVVVMEPAIALPNTSEAEKAINAEIFQKRLTSEHNDGSICFHGTYQQKSTLVDIARDIGCPTKGAYTVKGGYMRIIQRNPLSTKRCWFILKGNTLSYHKGPRDLRAIGQFKIGEICGIKILSDINNNPFSFQIRTSVGRFTISALSRDSLESWVTALAYARDLYHRGRGKGPQELIGSLSVHIGECNASYKVQQLSCKLQLEDQSFSSIITKELTADERITIPSTLQVDFDDTYSFSIGNPEANLQISLQNNDTGQRIGSFDISMEDITSNRYQNIWLEFEPDRDLKLQVYLLYSPSNVENIRIAETELVLSPLTPICDENQSNQLPVVTRMRTYDKEVDLYSSYSSSFISLPSEYQWLSGNSKVPKQTSFTRISQIIAKLPSDFVKKNGPLELTITRRFESRMNEFNCACFFGGQLWTGNSRGEIHVWQKDTCEQLSCIKAHNRKVLSIIHADAKVWSCSIGELCIWDPITKESIRTVSLEAGMEWKLHHIKTDLLEQVWMSSVHEEAGSKIQIWCAKTLQMKKKLQLRTTPVGYITQHDDIVWVGAVDYIIKLNPSNFAREGFFKVGLGRINSLVFNDRFVWISSDQSSHICVWDTESGEYERTLSEHTDKVLSMIQVDHFIVSCDRDCNIIIWDIESCTLIKSLPTTHTEPITQLLLDSSNDKLITASRRLVVHWNYSYN